MGKSLENKIKIIDSITKQLKYRDTEVYISKGKLAFAQVIFKGFSKLIYKLCLTNFVV